MKKNIFFREIEMNDASSSIFSQSDLQMLYVSSYVKHGLYFVKCNEDIMLCYSTQFKFQTGHSNKLMLFSYKY